MAWKVLRLGEGRGGTETGWGPRVPQKRIKAYKGGDGSKIG